MFAKYCQGEGEIERINVMFVFGNKNNIINSEENGIFPIRARSTMSTFSLAAGCNQLEDTPHYLESSASDF